MKGTSPVSMFRGPSWKDPPDSFRMLSATHLGKVEDVPLIPLVVQVRSESGDLPRLAKERQVSDGDRAEEHVKSQPFRRPSRRH